LKDCVKSLFPKYSSKGVQNWLIYLLVLGFFLVGLTVYVCGVKNDASFGGLHCGRAAAEQQSISTVEHFTTYNIYYNI